MCYYFRLLHLAIVSNLTYVLHRSNEAVIVESLNSNVASASLRLISLEPGDEILAVDGKKVTSIKQCIKNFKNSSAMKVVWRIKRKCATSLTPSKMDPWPEETMSDVTPTPSTSSAPSNFESSSRNSKSFSELTVLSASANNTPCHSRRSSMVRDLPSGSPNGDTTSLTEMIERRTSFPLRTFCSETSFPNIFKSADLPCCKVSAWVVTLTNYELYIMLLVVTGIIFLLGSHIHGVFQY